MAVKGIDNNKDENGKKKSNRNKILLASLIALALLSLIIFLGNPGLWTPDEDDGTEAEATDDSGLNDTNSTDQDSITNATDISTVVTLSNETSGQGSDDASDYDPNARPDGSGYVVIYSNSNSNSTSGSNGGGGVGGGGGGGGGSGGSNDDNSNTNSAPVAQDMAISTLEDNPVALQMMAADSDNDDITYSLMSSAAHGSLG